MMPLSLCLLLSSALLCGASCTQELDIESGDTDRQEEGPSDEGPAQFALYTGCSWTTDGETCIADFRAALDNYGCDIANVSCVEDNLAGEEFPPGVACQIETSNCRHGEIRGSTEPEPYCESGTLIDTVEILWGVCYYAAVPDDAPSECNFQEPVDGDCAGQGPNGLDCQYLSCGEGEGICMDPRLGCEDARF